MINYELKKQTLELDVETNILYWARKCRSYENGSDCISYDVFVTKSKFFLNFFPAEWNEAIRIVNSHNARVLRLKDKLSYMLTNFDCVFLTMTFSDSYLAASTPEARRLAIQRFLNSLDCCYIGNIDFGSDTEYVGSNGEVRQGTAREHYHAVVACVLTDEQIQFYNSHYGHINCKRCRCFRLDTVRLSKYVAKLCYHALKDSTRRHSLLYSRKHKFASDSELPQSTSP